MSWEVLEAADCVEAMREMDEASVDAIVTDPPYHLTFMGRSWDHAPTPVESQEQHRRWADQALRVLKPGGHLLAFGGTRTYHRLACAVEDAGFEIRDSLIWLYGSGFPKSLDVSKAIDKAAGAEREMRINERWAERYPNGPGGNLSGDGRSEHYNQVKRITEPLQTSDPATPEAAQWEGWGTALAPGHEPIVVARKPLTGTVASNVLQWGTGAINIDGSRVSSEPSRRMDGCQSNGSAPHAERISEWHPLESSEAKEPIALALAATQPEGEPVLLIRTGEAGASSVQMATLPSVTRAITSLSIGSSWSESLDASSNGTSMSITETATALTTDSGILSFCRSLTTPPTTIQDATPPAGCKCDALPAVESSSADGLKWSDTPLRIAAAPVTASGRWPKNVVLSHLPECERVGTRRVRGHKGYPNGPGGSSSQFSQKGTPTNRTEAWDGHPDAEVPAYSCAPGCPVAALDEQSGELSHGPRTKDYEKSGHIHAGHAGKKQFTTRHESFRGGASRFFYISKGVDDDGMGLALHRGVSDESADTEAATEAGCGNHACRCEKCRTAARSRTIGWGVSGVGEIGETETRFRYAAKASRSERNAGLDGFEERETRGNYGDGIQDARPHTREGYEYRAVTRNSHPTVKPIDLMRWLVRLVTPPGGIVLDPFTGSGTTGCAAVLEGFDFIGIEREAEYVEIAKARIEWWEQHRGREAEEVLADSRRSEAQREQHEAMGQLGLDFTVPVVRDNGNREGEASAERRYTEKGVSNFAMKPGRRRRD